MSCCTPLLAIPTTPRRPHAVAALPVNAPARAQRGQGQGEEDHDRDHDFSYTTPIPFRLQPVVGTYGNAPARVVPQEQADLAFTTPTKPIPFRLQPVAGTCAVAAAPARPLPREREEEVELCSSEFVTPTKPVPFRLVPFASPSVSLDAPARLPRQSGAYDYAFSTPVSFRLQETTIGNAPSRPSVQARVDGVDE